MATSRTTIMFDAPLCGRVDDLPFKEGGLELLRRKLEETSDYRITGHAIEFFGVCPECQGKENDDD